MVAFLIAASVATLKEFPNFNASLDGEDLVLKHYYNIGFAADTPQGLVVPVIKDADQKGMLRDRRASSPSCRARRARASSGPSDMQGATFTISSLGGIGGTSFTPIINAPEVAILGVTRVRAASRCGTAERAFVPRLMLPLSLSYDHRVIDGAAAARFVVHSPRCSATCAGRCCERRLQVAVPDIGDFTDIPVIEILVAAGDEIVAEDPLVTLESDKATMDVPSPVSGTVKQLSVKIGDRGRPKARR